MDFSDWCGAFGVTLVLVSYLMLHVNYLKASHLTYSLMNFFGALMILVSLYYHWNFPSAIVEMVWAMISLFGIYKALSASSSRVGKAQAAKYQ